MSAFLLTAPTAAGHQHQHHSNNNNNNTDSTMSAENNAIVDGAGNFSIIPSISALSPSLLSNIFSTFPSSSLTASAFDPSGGGDGTMLLPFHHHAQTAAAPPTFFMNANSNGNNGIPSAFLAPNTQLQISATPGMAQMPPLSIPSICSSSTSSSCSPRDEFQQHQQQMPTKFGTHASFSYPSLALAAIASSTAPSPTGSAATAPASPLTTAAARSATASTTPTATGKQRTAAAGGGKAAARPLAEMRKRWVKPEFCLICGQRAQCLNFGAHCCHACRMFFRRSVLNNKQFACKFDGNCNIKTGRCCRSCRFDACVLARLDISLIQFPAQFNVNALKQRLEERRRELLQTGRAEQLIGHSVLIAMETATGGGEMPKMQQQTMEAAAAMEVEQQQQQQQQQRKAKYLLSSAVAAKQDDSGMPTMSPAAAAASDHHRQWSRGSSTSSSLSASSSSSSSASSSRMSDTQQILPIPMLMNNNNNNISGSSSSSSSKIIVNGVENSFGSILELLEFNKCLDQLVLAHRLGTRIRASPNNLLLEYLCAKTLAHVLHSAVNVLNFVELFTMNGGTLRNRDADDELCQLGMAAAAAAAAGGQQPIQQQQPSPSPSIGNYLNLDTLLCIEQMRTLPGGLEELNAPDLLCLFRHNIHRLVTFSQAFHTAQQFGTTTSSVTYPNGAQAMLFGRQRAEAAMDGAKLKRLRKRAFCNVMDDLHAINLSIEEFVLLRAVLFFSDVPDQMSSSGKRVCQSEAERLARCLLRHQQSRLGQAMGAQRYAECLLFGSKIIHASRCQAKFYRILLAEPSAPNAASADDGGIAVKEEEATMPPPLMMMLPPFVTECMMARNDNDDTTTATAAAMDDDCASAIDKMEYCV